MSPMSLPRRLAHPGGVALVSLPIVVLALLDALGREGLRLGAWHPAPLPAAAWLLGLTALGLTLPRSSPRRPSAAALGLFVAAFALWTLAATRPPVEEAGGVLRARVRALSAQGLEERMLSVRLAKLRSPAGLAEACGRRGDLDLELSGALELPETGRYRFELACRGTCGLWLGELKLLHGTGRVAGEATLVAGSVPLRISLQQPKGRASLALDWDRPALLEASPLSAAASLEAPPAGTLRRHERRAMARAALQATAAAAAALLGLSLLRARLAWPRLRAWSADRVRRKAAAVGLGALLLLLALHAWSMPRALPGGYLHPWTSEYMMQTVSVADLRGEPLRSLFYLHIQPPLFDALRAVLVAANGDVVEDGALMRAVDHGLYACWALAYGAAVALVYVFLARLGGSRSALVGAGLFALHPATLFYATLLDSTFVSALFVLWLGYELWRLGPGRGSTVRLALSFLLLFFTRSLAQWPLLALLAPVLWLRGCERRRALRLLAALGLVIGLFLAKQAALFGLTITSSFGPNSFCRGLSAYCPGTTPVELPRALPPPSAASALRRTEKLNGEYNYNQLAFLQRSFSQMREYRELLRRLSIGELLTLMARNTAFWLRPSSSYSAHVLVDGLPWRAPFDFLLSGLPLVASLCGASLAWLRAAWPLRAALARGLALALPVLYFAATSIVFECGENMRYKFFVEPLLCVFLWSQASHAWSRLRAPGVAA